MAAPNIIPDVMQTLSTTLAALKGQPSVNGKDLAILGDLIDKLGLHVHLQVASEKFAEISLEGKLTAADEKFVVGSVALTLKIMH